MARLRAQIGRYGRSFAILLALAALGTAAGVYILIAQRLNLPVIGASTFAVDVRFPTAAGVVPGLGEPVDLAGVRVGSISGTSLQAGQGIVHMQIDPTQLPHGVIYRNASADLVPNTPLKDMQINLHPGSPSAGPLPHGATIPLAQSTSPIDSDDFLDALDTDTRTWFRSLLTDLNTGTTGRGFDIRRLLRDLGPTAAQTREIGDLLAARRGELAQVVHNLGVLTKAASQKDSQIQTVVRAGDSTLSALASQDVALRDAIGRLPGTLATTDKTLNDLIPFSGALGPAATALLPTAHKLPATLKQAQTLFQGAALLPLKEIPPFVNAVLPLAKQLGPVTQLLGSVVPSLTDSFKVLAYTVNELAYNPGGKNQGFLYWLAWGAHDLASATSTSDAHGADVRSFPLLACSSLRGTPTLAFVTQLLGSTFGC
jgi:phospholipid/cholesterol/gamma-HCH transport system substrate-binding protein